MLFATLLALALVVPPAPTARVNDYAKLLTAADRNRLEDLLAERERATGAQMVIAIFRSLRGENLEDFSIRLADKWRIGQKGLDNGAILLVFVNDRKLRLEVGYGLEAAIPDAVAGRIIQEAIAPRFRERRYAAGLEAAVNAVFERVTAAKARPAQSAAPQPEPPPFWAQLLFWGMAVILFGGFFALFIGLFVVLPIRAMRQVAYTVGREGWSSERRWGGSSSGSSGTSWGSGFSSGGSSSGGSFSGGGGSFGGGGASGSW
ncbi:MAG: TPM domain-containing protein [Candidatus Rokubacteria bacterium]|nr:TPM domain-containing protein [Candidatus Rokubacteria bacterium]